MSNDVSEGRARELSDLDVNKETWNLGGPCVKLFGAVGD